MSTDLRTFTPRLRSFSSQGRTCARFSFCTTGTTRNPNGPTTSCKIGRLVASNHRRRHRHQSSLVLWGTACLIRRPTARIVPSWNRAWNRACLLRRPKARMITLRQKTACLACQPSRHSQGATMSTTTSPLNPCAQMNGRLQTFILRNNMANANQNGETQGRIPDKDTRADGFEQPITGVGGTELQGQRPQNTIENKQGCFP